MAENTNITQANDGHKVPRPLNSFLFYRSEKQNEIMQKCPSANQREISRIVAKWWNDASEEEKNTYRELACIAKAEHKKLYPDYEYTPKKKADHCL